MMWFFYLPIIIIAIMVIIMWWRIIKTFMPLIILVTIIILVGSLLFSIFDGGQEVDIESTDGKPVFIQPKPGILEKIGLKQPARTWRDLGSNEKKDYSAVILPAEQAVILQGGDKGRTFGVNFGVHKHPIQIQFEVVGKMPANNVLELVDLKNDGFSLLHPGASIAMPAIPPNSRVAIKSMGSKLLLMTTNANGGDLKVHHYVESGLIGNEFIVAMHVKVPPNQEVILKNIRI